MKGDQAVELHSDMQQGCTECTVYNLNFFIHCLVEVAMVVWISALLPIIFIY